MNNRTAKALSALVALGLTASSPARRKRPTDRKIQIAIFNTARHLDDTEAAKGGLRIIPPQIGEGDQEFSWFMLEVMDSCKKQPAQTLYNATVPVYADFQAFAQSRSPKSPTGAK